MKRFIAILMMISLIFSSFSQVGYANGKENNLESTYKNHQELSNLITISAIDEETLEAKSGSTYTNLSLEGYFKDLVKNSGDPYASFNLKYITNKELSYLHENAILPQPSHTVTFNYKNEKGGKSQTEKYYVSIEPVLIDQDFSSMAVETIFDIGSFSLSVYEYNQNPSFWNGFWVVADGTAMVFPGVPAVSGVKRMIQGSPSVLKPALAKGVRPYSKLQTISAPASYMGNGWERHHIFEKRFASKLGTTESKMLAIFIPKYNYHYQITQRMSKKIPWYTASFKTKEEILRAHYEAYGELWAESGFADEYWEFLYKFSASKQYD